MASRHAPTTRQQSAILKFGQGSKKGTFSKRTRIQSRTPERLRGRVIGSYTALALAAGPLGLLAFGPLVDAFGPAVGFLLIGAGCVLAAVVAGLARGLRGLGRPARGTELPPDSAIRQAVEG